MDKLPQGSSEHEHLDPAISETPAFQGNLNVQIWQEGSTNFVSWDTFGYGALPYVTLTRQDTTNDTGVVTLLDHSYKYSPPYPDSIDALDNAGDVYAYTVALSTAVRRVGAQQTAYETVSPVIEPMPMLPPIESIIPIDEQAVEQSPVETIHKSPLVDLPSVSSEEHLQE